VGLGGGRAEHHRLGDLVVGEAVRDQGDDLAFAVGEPFHSHRGHRIGRPGDELADQTAGDRGRQERFAAHDDPERLEQPGRLGVLEQEPARARPQRAEDVLVETEVGEDHHAHLVQALVGEDLPGGLEAVEHRHLNVHQRDVRTVLDRQRHRLPPVGGLGDHLDVVFRFEQRPDAAADQRLVVGEQDPDHGSARIKAASVSRQRPHQGSVRIKAASGPGTRPGPGSRRRRAVRPGAGRRAR
jgi:hypothetical protein